MNRKLTAKEVAFLRELQNLMLEHSVLLSVEDGRVCFDVEYSGMTDPVEPVMLPEDIIASFDIEEFIGQNY